MSSRKSRSRPSLLPIIKPLLHSSTESSRNSSRIMRWSISSVKSIKLEKTIILCPCSCIYTGYSGLYGLYGININRKIIWTGDFCRVMILQITISLGLKTVYKYLKMQKKFLFQYLI